MSVNVKYKRNDRSNVTVTVVNLGTENNIIYIDVLHDEKPVGTLTVPTSVEEGKDAELEYYPIVGEESFFADETEFKSFVDSLHIKLKEVLGNG